MSKFSFGSRHIHYDDEEVGAAAEHHLDGVSSSRKKEIAGEMEEKGYAVITNGAGKKMKIKEEGGIWTVSEHHY